MTTVAETKLVDLGAIRHRHAATTGGEWYLSENDGTIINGKEDIAQVSTTDADACFMACAHQDVPAMAAEIETWRKAGQEMIGYLDGNSPGFASGDAAVSAIRALLPTT
jgi:hypothetical protein